MIHYNHHIATFMETLTGKQPGEWYPDFEKACKIWNKDPQEFLEILDDIRTGTIE